MISDINMVTKDSKDDLTDKEEDAPITDWRAIVVAGIVAFLSAFENTVIGMSEWPYMKTIDSDATAQFFGLVSSLSKVGHALFALAFCYWSYRVQNVRHPLVAGRILAFLACCLYLCVEFLPTGRRFLMLFCYFLFGIASSSSAVLRVYIVRVSSHGDRARAFSFIVLANMLSIVIGPLIQLCFIGIKYPGFEILPNIRVHAFSAPIWIASLTNFMSIAIIYYFLKELPKKVRLERDTSFFTLDGFKLGVRSVLNLDIVWPLVCLCWVQKVIGHLALVTLQTTVSPMLMTTFGWNSSTTVMFTAISMLLVGILAFVVGGAFMAGFEKICSPRLSFLIALLISVAMYVFSYPYPNEDRRLQPYNATTKTGCDPEEHNWCDTAYSTSPFLFLPVVIAVMGVGIPLASISLDTIYSKILGPIDQTIMQGAIVAVEDVVLIFGPLYSSGIYSNYGQSWLWILNGAATIAGALLWIVFFKKLATYK